MRKITLLTLVMPLLSLCFFNVAPGVETQISPAKQPVTAKSITSPKQHFGFNIGDDYCLANYQQLMGYWAKLERESDRLKVVKIGRTEEGRPQLMGIVTSPANHRELARYQEIARRLAQAEGVTEAEARQTVSRGQGGGVDRRRPARHRNALRPDAHGDGLPVPRRQRCRDAAHPRRRDHPFRPRQPRRHGPGRRLVHAGKGSPRQRSLSGLPRLYQKYIGHDNNRDFYANTQAETKNMNRVHVPGVVPANHVQPPPNRAAGDGAVLSAVPRSFQLQLRSAGGQRHRRRRRGDDAAVPRGRQTRCHRPLRGALLDLVQRRPAHHHLFP